MLGNGLFPPPPWANVQVFCHKKMKKIQIFAELEIKSFNFNYLEISVHLFILNDVRQRAKSSL